MRWLLFLFVFLFLLGCATGPGKQKFDVSLLNASQEDVFMSEQNKTLDKLSFIVQNNEAFDLECDVLLSLNNGTDESSKKGVVGMIKPGEQKKASLSFEMPYGQTSISIEPSCRRP